MGAVPSPTGGVIRFGVFEVDLRAGELRKHGVKIRLQEQPFQILQILLERPGEVVPREELRQRIWPVDTFVDFDHGLNNAIARLRQALCDSAENPRFVETLARRGYRFIGAVGGDTATQSSGHANLGSVVPWPTGNAVAAPGKEIRPITEAAAVPDRKTTPLRRRRAVITASVSLIVLLSVVLGLKSGPWRDLPGASSSPHIRSLAVIPLQNLSGDPAQEYFADGMTEQLITELSRISALKVISRTSVMRYKKTEKSLPEIARELNVEGIVEGSVLRSGERVRITAQLIYARTDANLWAETYDRDLRDVLTLQSAVAGAIANEVKANMTATERTRLKTARPVHLKALDAYLQGKQHERNFGRGFGDEELKEAIAWFQKAIDEDPNFVLAYVDLANDYTMGASANPEDVPLMRAAAEKAVAVDPDSAEAHWVLGADVKLLHDWDWAGAEKELRRALELNPNHAGAHEMLGCYLDAMGRPDQAMNEYERAQELDPLNDHLSGPLADRGEYGRALTMIRRFAETKPLDGSGHFGLAMIYARQGMHAEEIQEFQLVLTLYGLREGAARMGRIYINSGYQSALHELARQLEQLHAHKHFPLPVIIAETYARMGDKDRAFQWLETAYEERDGLMTTLKTDPDLINVRSDPRFADLVRRVGLPQ